MVYQMLCLLCNPLQLCHRQNGYEVTISQENGSASVIFTLRELENGSASVIFTLREPENGSASVIFTLRESENGYRSVKMELR